MSQVSSILKWWLTSEFPEECIRRLLNYKPTGFFANCRNFYRTWFSHPLRRRLVKYYLAYLRKVSGIRVVAVTGSAGKTTTKEMLASILSLDGKTVHSYANIDPVYNIPTTILKCKTDTKFLILEMGVEVPHAMDFYLWLAKPDVGVITNIYQTHTLFFKNTDGVFKEKSKLIKVLTKKDIVVLNEDNIYLRKFGKKINAKVYWFGKKSRIYASHIALEDLEYTKFVLNIGLSKSLIHLPLLGRQFVQNALAAASAAHALGIDLKLIKKGLERFLVPEHRMKPIRLKSGAIILDDSYNNNPQAAKETLKTFNQLSGGKKKIVVFGDMLELGSGEKEVHEEVGELVASMGIDYLITVGSLSKITAEVVRKGIGEKNVASVNSWSDAVSILKPLLTKNSIVLVKGSRSVHLECLIEKVIK